MDENDAAFPVGTQNYRIDDNLLTSPRSLLTRAYEIVLDWVSSVRGQIGMPKDPVLVVAALFTILPLLETLQFNRAAPAIRVAGSTNVTSGFFCVASVMRWLAPRRAHLSDEQRVTVQQAIDRLRSEWRNDPQDHATEALRAFIAEHILDAGRFDVAAREVLTCQEIVDRLKPKRMLIDALENPTTRILCALAHQNEIPVDYTWHGVYIQALKSDLLGSDPREPAYVSRSLTWGEHNEWWLRAIGSPVEMTRIGHPYASKLRSGISVQCWDRAQFCRRACIHDIKGLHHNQYAYFVRRPGVDGPDEEHSLQAAPGRLARCNTIG